LFSSSFRLVLKSHLQAHPHNSYLFESQRNTRFTARRIQQLVQGTGAPALLRQCTRISSDIR
jgi:hypothetical protein